MPKRGWLENMHFHKVDILSNVQCDDPSTHVRDVVDVLNTGTPMIALFDNGNKVKETDCYCRYLAVGSVLLLHDWEHLDLPKPHWEMTYSYVKDELEKVRRVASRRAASLAVVVHSPLCLRVFWPFSVASKGRTLTLPNTWEARPACLFGFLKGRCKTVTSCDSEAVCVLVFSVCVGFVCLCALSCLVSRLAQFSHADLCQFYSALMRRLHFVSFRGERVCGALVTAHMWAQRKPAPKSNKNTSSPPLQATVMTRYAHGKLRVSVPLR